jgi:hypothetical protein
MATWNVALISDLQSVSPGVGDAAIVAGYYAPGDLGGGIFYWEGTPPDCPTVVKTAPVNTAIADATDTFPIQITTATAHGYSTGQVVLIKRSATLRSSGNFRYLRGHLTLHLRVVR